MLRNNVQDMTNLHERLSMLLFRRMGEETPREVHAKMFVNEEYVGLFTIVESVDKGSDPASYVPLPFKPETNETNPRPEFIVQWVQAVNQSSAATFNSAVGEFPDFSTFIRHVAVEIFVSDYNGFTGNYGINNFYVYRFNNQ